ncbi:exonuclease domain-containing protein [Microterricola viridarii]|uniref:Exonuclease domain-containing protein n=1 Tax=Microterricola viridarii TaxID=412690 RepID=A0A0X8E2D3_9MICO|nr:exonuclease domain-containing protein [Microterricola viridarii]AMB59191.1 hypothetical protein AWU67_10305 [Microterricola viridarii]
MASAGFAVIDFETTGFSPAKHDRVVEVAVVHVNELGRVTGQWETLVNPKRDIGAQHIHGIRARDVLNAPSFDDIAGHLVELLDGRVVVAHNASFDSRFLVHELARSGYEIGPQLHTLCTMQLAAELIPGAGRSLADCCAAFDIDLDDAHRASADALATARLLGEYIGATDADDFWFRQIDAALADPWPPRALARHRDEVWRPRGFASAPEPTSFLERIAIKLPELAGPAEHQEYLALLDRCLIDRLLSAHESDALVRTADELSISRETCARLHHEYFDALTRIAWADGVLTTDEIADLAAVAKLLSIEGAYLTAAFQQPAALVETGNDARIAIVPGAFQLSHGDHVVLTGEMSRPRDDWHRDLTARGFVPKPAITKKVALVVAADPDSLSGKARKAREYGIPIVGESTLATLLGQ